MIEQWLDIEGFGGVYQISDAGSRKAKAFPDNSI